MPRTQRLAPAQTPLETGEAFGVRGIPALSGDRRFQSHSTIIAGWTQAGEWLQRMMPSAELVRFNNSPTQAVLSALRLARAHTGRPLILKFEGHYHGWADEGLVGFGPPPERWGPEENPSRLHPSQGV